MKTIEDAVKREKEARLKDLISLGIIHFGELINSTEFYRPAHFIYFDVLFQTKSAKVILDNI